MTGKVTVAVAGTVDEAEDIRAVLSGAGIEAELEGAETDVSGTGELGPCRVLVADAHAEMALQTLAEADEDDGEAGEGP
jgi:hypothetical protein